MLLFLILFSSVNRSSGTMDCKYKTDMTITYNVKGLHGYLDTLNLKSLSESTFVDFCWLWKLDGTSVHGRLLLSLYFVFFLFLSLGFTQIRSLLVYDPHSLLHL